MGSLGSDKGADSPTLDGALDSLSKVVEDHPHQVRSLVCVVSYSNKELESLVIIGQLYSGKFLCHFCMGSHLVMRQVASNLIAQRLCPYKQKPQF